MLEEAARLSRSAPTKRRGGPAEQLLASPPAQSAAPARQFAAASRQKAPMPQHFAPPKFSRAAPSQLYWVKMAPPSSDAAAFCYGVAARSSPGAPHQPQWRSSLCAIMSHMSSDGAARSSGAGAFCCDAEAKCPGVAARSQVAQRCERGRLYRLRTAVEGSVPLDQWGLITPSPPGQSASFSLRPR